LKNIQIHKIQEKDIPEIADIWYKVSLQAHNFIPGNYWKANKEQMMSKYIPMTAPPHSFLST